jgi:hypothetical protein
VESVPLIGWAGIENGELLRKAVEAGFDVLVTMDSNMVHQQNIGRYPIAVVALRAASNRLADTRPLIPSLLFALSQVKPGTVTFLPSLVLPGYQRGAKKFVYIYSSELGDATPSSRPESGFHPS